MYDKYGRGIYYRKSNHFLGGYTEQEAKIDFIGKPEYIITKHKKDQNSQVLVIKDAFTFTPQDLLLTQTHQIGNQAPQLLRKNEYNELGQLMRKSVGNNDITGANAFQKIDYRYNIRGWLTDINDYKNLKKTATQTTFLHLKSTTIPFKTITATQAKHNLTEIYQKRIGVRQRIMYPASTAIRMII